MLGESVLNLYDAQVRSIFAVQVSTASHKMSLPFSITHWTKISVLAVLPGLYADWTLPLVLIVKGRRYFFFFSWWNLLVSWGLFLIYKILCYQIEGTG